MKYYLLNSLFAITENITLFPYLLATDLIFFLINKHLSHILRKKKFLNNFGNDICTVTKLYCNLYVSI